MGVFLAIHLLHVAFKFEHFPFTNVGMFTHYAPDFTSSVELRRVYIVEEGGAPEVVSIRRMGDYLLAGPDAVDHQVALMLIKYRADRGVYDRIRAGLAAEGHPPPRIVDATLRFVDGRPVLADVRDVPVLDQTRAERGARRTAGPMSSRVSSAPGRRSSSRRCARSSVPTCSGCGGPPCSV